jgi:hypothetical protein
MHTILPIRASGGAYRPGVSAFRQLVRFDRGADLGHRGGGQRFGLDLSGERAK